MLKLGGHGLEIMEKIILNSCGGILELHIILIKAVTGKQF